MPPTHRVRITLDGDLAKALNWEAERRGIATQGLARSLLAESGSRIVESWRDGHGPRDRALDLPSPDEARSFEEVLRMSYGPAMEKGPPEGSGAT